MLSVASQLKSRFVSTYRGQWYYDQIALVYDYYTFTRWSMQEGTKINLLKIKEYENKYKNKRCFILGNGPSLNRTDLKKLKNEFTFGLNRIYLMYKKMGFPTSFLVSVNDLVIEQSRDDFNKLRIPKFFSWKAQNVVNIDKDAILLPSLVRQSFSKDISKGVWEGATVTYVAMQIAYYMGFEKVILIGVDHNFKTKGDKHKAIVSKGDDQNHFDPKYFGKGFKWNLPDLDTSEYAYTLAKSAYEENGREIIDATIGGKLKVFRKAEYNSLF